MSRRHAVVQWRILIGLIVVLSFGWALVSPGVWGTIYEASVAFETGIDLGTTEAIGGRLRSPDVLERILELTGVRMSPEELAGRVKTAVLGNQIRLSVRTRDGETGRMLIRSLADSFLVLYDPVVHGARSALERRHASLLRIRESINQQLYNGEGAVPQLRMSERVDSSLPALPVATSVTSVKNHAKVLGFLKEELVEVEGKLTMPSLQAAADETVRRLSPWPGIIRAVVVAAVLGFLISALAVSLAERVTRRSPWRQPLS